MKNANGNDKTHTSVDKASHELAGSNFFLVSVSKIMTTIAIIVISWPVAGMREVLSQSGHLYDLGLAGGG